MPWKIGSIWRLPSWHTYHGYKLIQTILLDINYSLAKNSIVEFSRIKMYRSQCKVEWDPYWNKRNNYFFLCTCSLPRKSNLFFLKSIIILRIWSYNNCCFFMPPVPPTEHLTHWRQWPFSFSFLVEEKRFYYALSTNFGTSSHSSFTAFFLPT